VKDLIRSDVVDEVEFVTGGCSMGLLTSDDEPARFFLADPEWTGWFR
jgi:hypothetical protein